MDTRQAGPPGARVARHVVTAPGLKTGLVPTRFRQKVANHVREVVLIAGFVIYDNVQVCLIKQPIFYSSWYPYTQSSVY